MSWKPQCGEALDLGKKGEVGQLVVGPRTKGEDESILETLNFVNFKSLSMNLYL